MACYYLKNRLKVRAHLNDLLSVLGKVSYYVTEEQIRQKDMIDGLVNRNDQTDPAKVREMKEYTLH